MELLDGTLKLRHCTTLLSMRFSPWSLPRFGNGSGKRLFFLLVIFQMLVVIWVKGSRLPRRHVQLLLLMSVRTQGIQRRGDGKDCAPLPPKERGVMWACLAIFFLDLELGDIFALGDAWNLPSEGTGVGFFRLVSPAEGVSALALTRLIHCMRLHIWLDTRVMLHVRTTTSPLLPTLPTHPPTQTPTSLKKTTNPYLLLLRPRRFVSHNPQG